MLNDPTSWRPFTRIRRHLRWPIWLVTGALLSDANCIPRSTLHDHYVVADVACGTRRLQVDIGLPTRWQQRQYERCISAPSDALFLDTDQVWCIDNDACAASIGGTNPAPIVLCRVGVPAAAVAVFERPVFNDEELGWFYQSGEYGLFLASPDTDDWVHDVYCASSRGVCRTGYRAYSPYTVEELGSGRFNICRGRCGRDNDDDFLYEYDCRECTDYAGAREIGVTNCGVPASVPARSNPR